MFYINPDFETGKIKSERSDLFHSIEAYVNKIVEKVPSKVIVIIFSGFAPSFPSSLLGPGRFLGDKDFKHFDRKVTESMIFGNRRFQPLYPPEFVHRQ